MRARRPFTIPGLAVVALGAGLVAAASLGTWGRAGAQGFVLERISRYNTAIRIEDDGSLLIRETIDYDFGGSARHGIIRSIPDRLPYNDRYDRVYPIDVLSVTGSPGTPVQTEEEGRTAGSIGYLDLRIGDPNRTIRGEHTYVITYRVRGALNGFREYDELYWNAIGTEWSVPIDRATVRVQAPTKITQVACFAGPAESRLPCDRAGLKGDVATFSDGGLPPYNGMSVVVAIPPGSVPVGPALKERWSVERAFALTPVTGGLAAAVFAVGVGAFAFLAWRGGRDRRFVGSPIDALHGNPTGAEETVPLFDDDTIVAEFAPPDDLRPGQVGTIIDERAEPLDVTASIVDLAVRGYLRIEEIPKEGLFGKADWRLVKLKPAGEDLLEYERILFDGLFETGDSVELSGLATKFYEKLGEVEDALYDNAVNRGWFSTRPDKVRARWHALGVLLLLAGIGLAVALAIFTRFGIVGLPLVVVGLVFLIGGGKMPRRTARGTGVYRRVLGFREVIDKAETQMARFQERENIFSTFLPYAVVFGLTDKWANAFARLGIQPDTSSWYVSPSLFTVAAFSQSMSSFAVSSAGVIASRPASSGSSGFSAGGGFSGGGGGGGGGGSW